MKLPMQLQFFADEETEQKEEETVETAKEPEKEEQKDTQADVQALMVEVAKLKRAQEKAASEAAEYKKKWKESLSVQEQASMEKAEKEAAEAERVKMLERKVAVSEYTENYLDLGYPKELAKKAAEAQADSDNDTLLEIQKQVQEISRKKWEEEFLKSRPEIVTGAGEGNSDDEDPFLKGFKSI